MTPANAESFLNQHLKQQVSAFDQRLQELNRLIEVHPSQGVKLTLDCLEEIQVLLEQLQVAEEELRQQNESLLVTQHLADLERERYQELFEFAPDGYLVTDLFSRIQEANRTAAKLFNISPQYLIGKLLVGFVPVDFRRQFRSMLNHLPTLQRVEEWEVNLAPRKGEIFQAAMTVEVVKDQWGQAISLRWMVRDITARKRSEEQIQQLQLQNFQLLESDRLKNQFMATVTHELRTPMNAILGFSELMLRQAHQENDAALIAMVEPILRSGRHLLNMIEEILDFSRLQSKGFHLDLHLLNLVELVQSTVEDLQVLAQKKSLGLVSKLEVQELLILNDPVRLRQVLVNLIANAIKFTEVGAVTIEVVLRDEHWLTLTVSDTGIGIDACDQSQIFQEFWQVDQSSHRKYKGIGLGLSITYELVKLMGGKITVESVVGEGSSFQVELPCQVLTNEEKISDGQKIFPDTLSGTH